MEFSKIVFYYIVLFLQAEKTFSFNNMSAIKNFPPLYNFDDYDKCLRLEPNIGTYCIVYAEIVPNESIPLWLEIEKLSSDNKRHYRHDHLFFGVCLERCLNISMSSSVMGNDRILNDIADEELKTHYIDVYNSDEYSTSNDRQNLSNFFQNCLNRDFTIAYNLSLRTFVEYCEKNDAEFHWDIWHTSFISLVAFIAISVFLSSFYDLTLKRRQPLCNQTNDFYKLRLSHTAHMLLTSFSICRNYYRLNRAPNSKIEDELKFLDGIRVITMFFVILAHVVVVFMVIHVQNPDFFEQFYYRIEVAIFENGTVILQMFFFMSGFLLYVNFMERKLVTAKSGFFECFKIYFRLLLLRFLRLAPSIALLLLFTVSFLGNMQDGPFWRHIAEAERRFCRDYWWKSLLLQNNIVDMRKNCLHHTWYIATDMQLFGIFLSVVIAVSKYPKIKKSVFIILLILSITIPAIVTYVRKLDAFFITNPESYRFLYFKDTPTLFGSYLPFYTNMAGYLFGVWFADIYLEQRVQKRQINYLKLNVLWWLIFPVGLALLISGYWFIANDFERPSIWEALYAGLFRNIWSFMMGLLILGLCFQVGWIGFEFLSLSCFRIIARSSYQSYLWHTIVIRILMGYFRAPVHVNRLFVFSNFIATLVLTHVVAYFVTIFCEYPFAEIICCIFKQKKHKPSRNHETGEVFVLSDRNGPEAKRAQRSFH